MIRRLTVVLAAALLGLLVAAPAAAAAGPQRVCRAGDDRLVELSGLVATRSGYVVMNDGVDDKAGRRIFFLNTKCKVVRAVPYPSRPRDTEDMAMAADGTLWVADIGDNNENRDTIGLWRLAPGAKSPRLYRMTYPDGAHNAEALLLTAAGAPIVVTKTVGSASVYVPTGALDADRTTPLRRAGYVTVPVTRTSNPFSLPGRLTITGGAVSPDGHRVTLRTYADAFEYDAPDGDLVRAVTTGKPRTIPLPDEPQGESVAYTTDGAALLTVSEGSNPELLRYPLPPRPALKATSAAPRSASAKPEPTAVAAAHRADLSTGAMVAGAVLVGAALLLGAIALRRRG